MPELIDRQATLGKIETLCKAYLLHEPAGMGGLSAIKLCKEIVEKQPTIEVEPAQRWIPCAERLPEVYEKVLTYSDEGIIHDNFRLNLRDGSIGWSQGWVVTHWQPRPEPPEGGAEDENKG
jgi:hypothetical protein